LATFGFVVLLEQESIFIEKEGIFGEGYLSLSAARKKTVVTKMVRNSSMNKPCEIG